MQPDIDRLHVSPRACDKMQQQIAIISYIIKGGYTSRVCMRCNEDRCISMDALAGYTSSVCMRCNEDRCISMDALAGYTSSVCMRCNLNGLYGSVTSIGYISRVRVRCNHTLVSFLLGLPVTSRACVIRCNTNIQH